MKNPSSNSRTRHIDISHHFIRELVSKGAIRVEYIPSNKQFADGLTKILGIKLFFTHKTRHNLVPIYVKE